MHDHSAAESWEPGKRHRADTDGSERWGWLISAALVLGVVAFLVGSSHWPWPRNRAVLPAKRNLKQIVIALHRYAHRQGAFPYDPRGGQYALYLLADELPASCLDAYPYKDPRAEAAWDDTRAAVSWERILSTRTSPSRIPIRSSSWKSRLPTADSLWPPVPTAWFGTIPWIRRNFPNGRGRLFGDMPHASDGLGSIQAEKWPEFYSASMVRSSRTTSSP